MAEQELEAQHAAAAVAPIAPIVVAALGRAAKCRPGAKDCKTFCCQNGDACCTSVTGKKGCCRGSLCCKRRFVCCPKGFPYHCTVGRFCYRSLDAAKKACSFRYIVDHCTA